MESESDIVLVPVPVSMLGAVYRLLADLLEDEATQASVPGSVGLDYLMDQFSQLTSFAIPRSFTSYTGFPRAAPRPDVPWTAEDIVRLSESLRVYTVPSAYTMLDMAAANPGQEVSFSDVVDATGLPFAKVRGQISSFSTCIHNDFERQNWPVDVRKNRHGRQCYVFSDTSLAQAWIATRG